MSHSVLKHVVAVATRVTRQSCRFLGALCDSPQSGSAKSECISCLEESSVAFRSNGLYIGLRGLCVCVCVFLSMWAGMSMQLQMGAFCVHVFLCVFDRLQEW